MNIRGLNDEYREKKKHQRYRGRKIKVLRFWRRTELIVLPKWKDASTIKVGAEDERTSADKGEFVGVVMCI